MITIRPFAWADLPALVTIVNAAAEVDREEERYDAAKLREEIEAHNDPLRDCVVAAMPDGAAVGFAYVEQHVDDDRVWGYGWGAVHPDQRRQGIGTALVRAADARFAARAAQSEVAGRVAFIQRYIIGTNPGAAASALSLGYVVLRSSYRMQISLDGVLPPDAPPGFRLRSFDKARDSLAVYEVDQAAFMDGGGQPERMPYDFWRGRYVDADDFNPALWVVAVADAIPPGGETVVGYAFSRPWGSDQPDLAWINRLGVLRAWRGQGVGLALLQQAIFACQRAGFRRASLGVRADSEAAIALYRRAGMAITSQYTHYRRVLRGNPAEIMS